MTALINSKSNDKDKSPETQVQDQVILGKTCKSGQKFTRLKRDSSLFSEAFALYGEKYDDDRALKYAFKMAECTSWMQSAFLESPDGERTLVPLRSNSCRVRGCPRCAYVKRRRVRALALKRLEALAQTFDFGQTVPIMLTLTVKNPKVEDLRQTIIDLHKGFDRLMKRQNVKDYCLGYIRATEVTHNSKTDTAHPHLHVTLLMKAEFLRFIGREKVFAISHDEWLSMWKECMRVDYQIGVNVKRSYKKREFLGEEITQAQKVMGALGESIKYECKVPRNDLKTEEGREWWVKAYLQMQGLRLVSSGGVLKGVVRYQLTEEEEAEADYAIAEGKDLEENHVWSWRYNYQKLDYFGHRTKTKVREYLDNLKAKIEQAKVFRQAEREARLERLRQTDWNLHFARQAYYRIKENMKDRLRPHFLVWNLDNDEVFYRCLVRYQSEADLDSPRK